MRGRISLLISCLALLHSSKAQHLPASGRDGSHATVEAIPVNTALLQDSFRLVADLPAGNYLDNSNGRDTATPVPRPAAYKTTVLWLENNVTGTTSVVPFWMRANRFGSVPLSGLSTSFIAHAEKTYDVTKKRFLDWGVAVEGRANLGQQSNFTLIEGFAKLKLGPFEIRGGRVKEQIGFVDSTLSSGAFAISGNALGVPKVELRVPQFTHIFGGRLFAFQGNIAHGWIGQVPTQKRNSAGTGYLMVNTYFHQKSLYGRFGKEHWKVRLYGGFNHQVFWGDEKVRYGSQYAMTGWETFRYVLEGRKYSVTSSKIGNHVGSIDLGLELNLKNFRLLAYRQNFYEVGGLYYLANIQDGLQGISLTRKVRGSSPVQWRKILVEFMYSKNQGGESWSPNTPTGAENYYNNYEYNQGWSYKGFALGTPFMTTRTTARAGFPSPQAHYFINNRVALLHTGVEGAIHSLLYTVKLSYSKNYGTWRTNSYGQRIGGPNTNRLRPNAGIFVPVNQFSSYLELHKPLKNGISVGAVLALDNGGLLYNTVGGQIRLVKVF